MPQRDRLIDDDALPVMVPRNGKALVPISPERVQRLREHLAGIGRVTRVAPDASSARPEPGGFAAQVARAACSLCRGWCCRNGGDDAFLDERTLARVRRTTPELDVSGVQQLYVERVPSVSYEGSCIFHAKQGCMLDRSMRSDVCNAYFCGGLQTYLTGCEAAMPTVVIAGEGSMMRTSPVIVPKDDFGGREKDAK